MMDDNPEVGQSSVTTDSLAQPLPTLQDSETADGTILVFQDSVVTGNRYVPGQAKVYV